jgi:hypothetical protein
LIRPKTCSNNEGFVRLFDPPQGSAAAKELAVRAEVLGAGIPARSNPAGANALNKIGATRNFNLNSTDPQTGFQTGWPAIRPLDSNQNPRWYHSDMKDVAYPYNHKMHDKIVELGGLKQ